MMLSETEVELLRDMYHDGKDFDTALALVGIDADRREEAYVEHWGAWEQWSLYPDPFPFMEED